MILTEIAAVPEAALPVEALKDHLRLGAGFALPPGQDGLLASYLRAAMAAIEGRIAKALIARRFRWTSPAWRGDEAQALPIAPVATVVSLTMVAADGTPTEVPPAQYRLLADLHRPRLAGAGGFLPAVPAGGRAELVFDAGFGPVWQDVPADLRQAVLFLAAEYFEHRHDDGSASAGLPHAVTALTERWRQIRVLGGRGRA